MQRNREASRGVVVLPIDGVGDDGKGREGRKAQAALGSRVTKLQPGWLEALVQRKSLPNRWYVPSAPAGAEVVPCCLKLVAALVQEQVGLIETVPVSIVGASPG